jgi:WD40 repeat protein
MFKKNYHLNLASYFTSKPLYLDEPTQKKHNTRKLVEQPWQQTKAEMWDEVTDTLCNLDFIQAKAAAKMTYELVNDFNAALLVIPDNAKNICKEKEPQARLEKYTRDLIACANGKIPIDKLEIPESVTPWTEEQIDAEIERIKTNPNRADRLMDFLNFLGQESANLQNYASEFPYFATQQAWNFANSGPVGKAAEKGNPEVYKTLLLRSQSTRPTWNPFPVVLRTIFANRKDGNYYASSIVITPDGRQAILSSENGTHLLWDLESGVIKKEAFLHPSVIIITKDGRYVVSASSNGTFILWEFQSGEIIATFYGNCESFLSIAITLDRKMAVTSSKNTCILWDLQSGKPKKKLSGIAGAKHIVIAPDSNQVVLTSNDYCTILDLKRNKSIKIIKGEFIAITHDGKQGIRRTNELCILWDIQNDHPTKFLEGHYDFVSDISITLDGKLAITASQDKTCILWDLQSGKPLKILDGHFSFVNLVAITPDGKHAVSKSNDNTFILWNLENGKPNKTYYKQRFGDSFYYKDINADKTLEPLIEHIGVVKSVMITLNGKLVVSKSIHPQFPNNILWDIKTGKHIKTLSDSELKSFTFSSISKKSIAITPDEKVLLMPGYDNGDDKVNLLLRDKLQNTGKKLSEHGDIITSIAISSDGKLAITGSLDKTCVLWDLRNQNKLAIFIANQGIECFALKRDNLVIGGNSGGVFFLKILSYYHTDEEEIVTIKKSRDSIEGRFQNPTTNCPLCGYCFAPPASVLATIAEISKKAGLKPEQSPCLELPDEAWEEPGLLGNCPKCGEKLKFNPFIAGGE